MPRPFKSSKVPTDVRRYEVGRQLSSYQPVSTGLTGTTYPLETPSKKRLPWKRISLVLIALILSPLLIIGMLDYRNASGASEKLFGSSNLLSILPPNSSKNTEGSTNILLIGYSADDPGHDGALLTDSIMLVSLNKERKSGYTLSIPRDLYVDIPEYGSAKINEAYQAGERQQYNETGFPAGGPGLLQKVVSQSFEIPIHHYIVINYGAVRDITDALGGITVPITSTDPRGLYDPNFKPEEGGPLTLANGPQELDGQTALRLSRARGSTAGSYGFPQSDFDRAANQQKVFAAIKSKLSISLLVDPRTNKPIFDAVANNVQTNVSLDQVLPVFNQFRAVPDTSVKQVNLRDFDGKNYLASYQTRSGQSALVPSAGIDDYSEIINLLNQL